jgi:uncharacterized protein (TIGR03435 family)
VVQKLLEDASNSLHHETKDMYGERKQTFQHFPIMGLVNLTSNGLHTPVVDSTGIKSFYDYVLDPAQFMDAGGASPPSFADLLGDRPARTTRPASRTPQSSA